MNRGINDSQDLPREYLGKIYDEIAQCGIQTRSDYVTSVVAPNGTTGNSTNGVTSGARDIMESVILCLSSQISLFKALAISQTSFVICLILVL